MNKHNHTHKHKKKGIIVFAKKKKKKYKQIKTPGLPVKFLNTYFNVFILSYLYLYFCNLFFVSHIIIQKTKQK